jgi:hypothetical protein
VVLIIFGSHKQGWICRRPHKYMIRPEHQFYIRPDLHKAASTKAESTTAKNKKTGYFK